MNLIFRITKYNFIFIFKFLIFYFRFIGIPGGCRALKRKLKVSSLDFLSLFCGTSMLFECLSLKPHTIRTTLTILFTLFIIEADEKPQYERFGRTLENRSWGVFQIFKFRILLLFSSTDLHFIYLKYFPKRTLTTLTSLIFLQYPTPQIILKLQFVLNRLI